MATAEAPARAPKISGAVRVTLPISVAYNLEKFQKALANIATQVGHTGCTSGVDLTFLNVRDFVVDPASLEVTPMTFEH